MVVDEKKLLTIWVAGNFGHAGQFEVDENVHLNNTEHYSNKTIDFRKWEASQRDQLT